MNHHHARLLLIAFVLPVVAFDATPGFSAASFEDQVMEMVNQERWNNGNLPPLKRNAILDTSSETHSGNMATRDFFAHCDPDNGTLPWDRMTAAGYVGWNSAGENIAAGYSSPSAVMTGWMNSSGHRANILSTGYREIGIGYVSAATDVNNIRQDANGDCTADSFTNGPYYRYWTQNFGRINTVYPVVINREAYETTSAIVSLYVYGSGWAVDVRFRNENGAWSAWQPYATDVTWTLSAGNGTKTVNAELRNGATVRSVSDAIVLNANADLVVTLTDVTDPVDVGSDITWQVTVTNNGTSPATGITITDVLPANVSFVSASVPYALNAGTLSCSLPSLSSGANQSFSIVAQAVSGSGVTNTVSVQGSEPDPNAANNLDSETTSLVTPSAAGDGPGVTALALKPARPNPFSSRTRLSYDLPATGHVRITIHDAAGRVMTTLRDESQPAGSHDVTWDGTDATGRPLANGVYFSRLETAGQVRTTKMLLVR